MSEEYRVNLDIYNGPLDLLLYLIRRDEVDIHDIPIAHITAQYVQYVEMLQDLVVAAINEAMRKIEEVSAERMSRVTGGMGMPRF